jgi:hypothetical protein
MLASASKPRLAGLLLAALLALARGAAASGIEGGECDTSTTTSCDLLWSARPEQAVMDRGTSSVPWSLLAANNGFVYAVIGTGQAGVDRQTTLVAMMRCRQEDPNSCTKFNDLSDPNLQRADLGYGPMALMPSGDQIVVGVGRNMARRAGAWRAAVHASCVTLSDHCPPHAVAL